MNYLRKLMGDQWVNAELFGENPTHQLGLWQSYDPNKAWLPYVDELLREMLTHGSIECATKDLKRKIKAEFTSTLAEMESAVFLAGRGFRVTVEPTAPKAGPDLRAERDGIEYFIEVKKAGFSWEERRMNEITTEVFSILNTVPSSYFVSITVGEAYVLNSASVRAAMDVVIECLKELKKENLERATLYYAHPDGKLLNPGGDASHIFAKAHYQEIVDKAEFIARFRNPGEEQDKTPATVLRRLKLPPEPVNSHERLKTILVDKCDQLPKESRGVFILDVSQQFMLSDFTIDRALYGDTEVQFAAPSGPGDPVGNTIVMKNERGFFFFEEAARVSAVVIHKRTVEGAQIMNSWEVYPTNRANPGTIRLSLAELEWFGDVGDRKNLAEDAPEDGEIDAWQKT